MYNVIKLYLHRTSNVNIYDPAEMEPLDFANLVYSTEFNKHLFVAVENTETDTFIALDYSRMILEQAIPHNAVTWVDFAASLTDALIDGYTTNIPGYLPGKLQPAHRALWWDAMSTLRTFDISYADAETTKSNIFGIRWTLRDIKISLQDTDTVKPDLTKCLPIVNGFACRPQYNSLDKSLYGLDGAHLLWQTNEHFTAEIGLIDFSEVASEVKICSISTEDQANSFKLETKFDQISLIKSWRLINKDIDLSQYVPIVVLCGVMLLPDSLTIPNANTIICSPQLHPIHNALAYKGFLKAKSDTSAEITYTSSSLVDYFTEQLQPGIKSPDCFVILLKTSRLMVTKVPLDIWKNEITINLYTDEGLLLHNATHTFKSYHTDVLEDRKELTVQNLEIILKTDENFDQKQMAMVDPDCAHEKFLNLRSGNCSMLYLYN